MNQFEMIAIIVLVAVIGSVLKARFRGHRGEVGEGLAVSASEQAENLRLREEVKDLKERLHVLERITVEKEDSLSREIEQLRDR